MVEQGGVKLGFRQGRKTGQAVILFRDELRAQSALKLHNYFAEGRVLEVMVIAYKSFLSFN